MIDTRAAERADVLVLLESRQAECSKLAKRSPEFEESMRAQDRMLSILIETVRAGLHESEPA